jgi:hypothetical protein
MNTFEKFKQFAKDEFNMDIERSDVDGILVDEIFKERKCCDCVQFMPLGRYNGTCRFQDSRSFIDGRRDATWCPVYHEREKDMW